MEVYLSSLGRTLLKETFSEENNFDLALCSLRSQISQKVPPLSFLLMEKLYLEDRLGLQTFQRFDPQMNGYISVHSFVNILK